MDKSGKVNGVRCGVMRKGSAQEVFLEIKNRYETDAQQPVLIALNRV